jgi:hypothetical protein
MSSEQAAVLSSRVICVFLLYFLVADLAYLPGHILTFHHWQTAQTGYTPEVGGYLRRYETLGLESNVIRILIELFLLGTFFRCGDSVTRFLIGERASSGSTPEGDV